MTDARPHRPVPDPAAERGRRLALGLPDALTARDVERRGRAVPARRASGATWSPSPGTSTPSRAATGVADLLRATLDAHRPDRLRAPPRRRPRPAASPRRGWPSRPPSAAARRTCGCGPTTTAPQGLDPAHHPPRAQGPRGAAGERRPKGAEHGANRERLTWKERREQEAAELGRTVQPYVVVVGGGQGGIALGARLAQLGVPAIIVEKNERPGDSWRNRYKSLCLHDPVWYDHLPYLPFPTNWPVFAPKDKIGDWLEMYTRVMELDYWGSTTATSARYDEAHQEWEVVVDRDGEQVTLRPKQLVMALGVSGKPNVPDFPGHGPLPRRPAPLLRSTPGPTRTRARRPSSSARTTPRTTSAPRCGRPAPTSRWCSARARTSCAATR